jgi:hypothetical protein
MGGSSSGVSKADLDSLKSQMTKVKSDVTKLQTDSTDPSARIAKTIDYKSLADKIMEIDSYKEGLASKIADNPGKLGDELGEKLGASNTIKTSLGIALEGNTKFAETLAGVLTDTSKTYHKNIKGPKGEAGSLSGSKDVLKQNLYDTGYTMWCADGDLCALPTGKKGLNWGYGGSKITDDGQLRIQSDDQLWLQVPGEEVAVRNDWGGISVRNPDDGRHRQGEWTHFGHKHGHARNYIRGHTQIDGEIMAPEGINFMRGGSRINDRDGQLHLDTDDWVVMPGARLRLGAWEIDASDGNIRFRKDGDGQMFVIHNKGWHNGSTWVHGNYHSSQWNKWL